VSQEFCQFERRVKSRVSIRCDLRIGANAELLIDIITDGVYLEDTISQPFQLSFNKA